MKPPICYCCLKQFDPGAVLVRFADYQPLPNGMAGHPKGMEWFCAQHAAAAQAVAHLPLAQAMQKMRG